MASEWIRLNDDLSKKIIHKGTLGNRPHFWSEVELKFVRCSLESDILPPVLCSSSEDCVRVRVGKACDEWSRILNVSIQLMDEGELSLFRAKSGDGTLIEFQLNLVTIVSQALLLPLWEVPNMIEVGHELKNLGVTLHKEKRTVDSFHLFAQALKILLPAEVRLTQQVAANSENVDEQARIWKEEITPTISSLYSNLAACQLEKGNYDMVLHLCDNALERNPSDSKAIYRKASALIGNYTN